MDDASDEPGACRRMRLRLHLSSQSEPRRRRAGVSRSGGCAADADAASQLHGEPMATWIYRDANGAELCRILRFDLPDGPSNSAPSRYGARRNACVGGGRPFPRRAHCTASTDLRPVLTRP